MHDIEYARQVLYAGAGAISWLAWDLIIHFDIEIECIWLRPRLWVKCAYAFVRYVPILHGGAVLTLGTGARFSTVGCRGWVYYQLIFMELLTFVVEVVLVIRLYILYNQNKIMLWVIILAFVAEIVVMIAALTIVLPQMTFTPDCLVSSAPNIFMSYWLSSLAFETFLFILTLVKFFQSVSKILGHQTVLFIFMRDGTWAFALIFVAMLLNTLMYKLSHSPLVGMGYYWAMSVMSFAGSHVLLNIRRLGMPTEDLTLTTTIGEPLVHDVRTNNPEEIPRVGTWTSTTTALGSGCYEMTTLRSEFACNVDHPGHV